MFNLLITDGQIIDGTGSGGYYGSVAIEDDRLTILRGDVSYIQADRTISAHDRVICPGFIDLHAHSGLIMLAEPLHEPKVRQGITTELIGVDAEAFAQGQAFDECFAHEDAGRRRHAVQRTCVAGDVAERYRLEIAQLVTAA